MFPYLAENFRLSCQKCTLRVQVNIRGKIGFPRKCLIFFVVTFGFYGKKCRILVEEFDKFVRAAFDPYGRSFWRKTTSRKNLVFHIILGLRGENILIRHNLVCSLLTRLSFLTLELHFEVFFQQFRIFSSISGFQCEFLPYLAQKFRHSRQKCILRVQTKVWWKIGFRLEQVRIFHEHLDSTQKMSDFWWKISARSPGLHFSYTRARFKKITIVSKELVFFIIMGLRVESKKIWLLTKFCPHCCRNFILSLQGKNLIFLEQFSSSYPFWDPSRNCWDFLGKNFSSFVEAAFYVYRQTIWRETILSK